MIAEMEISPGLFYNSVKILNCGNTAAQLEKACSNTPIGKNTKRIKLLHTHTYMHVYIYILITFLALNILKKNSPSSDSNKRECQGNDAKI